LILAHQYIEQLDEKVQAAIFGNVGTLTCFRVGAEDAEFLEKEFLPEFSATDLVNLSKYGVYLKLMIDGVASKPFSAETLEPLKPDVESLKDVIIENCRHRFSTSRKAVEEKIASEWLSNKETGEDRIQRRDEQSLGKMLAPQEQPERTEFPKKERKAVDISDLRKTLEESLKDIEDEEENKQI